MTKNQVLSFKFRILVKCSLVLKSFKFMIGKIYWEKKVLNFSLVGTNFWHSEWKPLQYRNSGHGTWFCKSLNLINLMQWVSAESVRFTETVRLRKMNQLFLFKKW